MVSDVIIQVELHATWKLDMPALHVVLLLLWHQILVVLNASEKRLANIRRKTCSALLSNPLSAKRQGHGYSSNKLDQHLLKSGPFDFSLCRPGS